MTRQNQRAQTSATNYQNITLYQSGIIENTIETWVDDIATNSGNKGLSMAAFKAVSSNDAYNDENLQKEMKDNDIFDSVEALHNVYTDSNPGEKLSIDNVNPSEVRAVINKYIQGAGKLKATEAELERRKEPMQRPLGAEMASAPSAPAANENTISSKGGVTSREYTGPITALAVPDRKITKSLNLYEAAQNNDLEGINRFLSQGADVNERYNIDNEKDLTALHGAAKKNNADAINLLVTKKADLEAKNSFTKPDGTKLEGITPLHEAAVSNNPEAIEALVKAGANLNAKDSLGNTPLSDAVRKMNTESAVILKKAGATLGNAEKYNNQLNEEVKNNLAENGLSNADKIRGLFFLGAEMPALEGYAASFKTAVKEMQKQGKRLGRQNPTATTQQNSFVEAENTRRQQQVEQSECCVIS